MRWPWKRAAEEADMAARARERLESVLADWAEVRQVTGVLHEAKERNHITERAFVLRERGKR